MKRYAIVRVDNNSDNNCKNCEMLYTNDNGNNDCRLRIGASFLCDRYGDTKAQLVRKIETAVAIMRNKMENKEVYLDRAVATFIVEFLGVEE